MWSYTETSWASMALGILIILICCAADRVTRDSAGTLSTGRTAPALCFSGLFLAIVGAKLHLISGFGSDVPYWDQWDAEALLYINLLMGAYNPISLLTPHNEHRILLTRLLGCDLLHLNGQWDPLLGMAVNAVIHSLVLMSICFVLWRCSGRKHLPVLCVATALFGMLPFGWENTLAAFQSQFYFLIGFSFLAMVILLRSQPFSFAWFLGIVSAVCAQFSMASGLLAAAAIAGVLLIACSLLKDAYKKYLVTILLLLAVAVVEFITVPHIPANDALKVTDPVALLRVFGKTMAWPFSVWPLAPVLWAPLAIVLIRCIQSGTLNGYEALLLCIGLWVLLQDGAMAYSRGGAVSRYTDIIAVGLLANLAASLILARKWLEKGSMRATVVWLSIAVLVLSSGVSVFHKGLPRIVLARPAILQWYEITTAGYVLTGDKAFILNQPESHIPYPSGDTLIARLNDAGLRQILPVSIRAPLSLQEAECSGFTRNASPPGIEKLSHRMVYGTCTGEGRHGSALYLSQPVRAGLAWLVFDIAGGGPGTSLEILPEGSAPVVIGTDWRGEGWRQVYARAPGKSFRLKVTADGDNSCIAFSLPRELAAGGYFIRWVLPRAFTVAIAGLIMLVLGSLLPVCGSRRQVSGFASY